MVGSRTVQIAIRLVPRASDSESEKTVRTMSKDMSTNTRLKTKNRPAFADVPMVSMRVVTMTRGSAVTRYHKLAVGLRDETEERGGNLT